jgi:hypothetical protein
MQLRPWPMALCIVLSSIIGPSPPAICGQQQPEGAGQSGSEGFVSIFDGRTLDGWHAVPKERASDWTVRDGAIVGRGNHFQFFINGKLASEFTDNARQGRLDQGAIGLQIHDKGMQVEFKDIRLKRRTSVTVPFVSPKGDYVTQPDRYHTFRIPGMIVAPDGSVLLFAEGRRGDGSDPRRDENAPIDLVMRRSIDNGRSWEPMAVIDSGFRPNGDLIDFADPTPVLLSPGRIVEHGARHVYNGT